MPNDQQSSDKVNDLVYHTYMVAICRQYTSCVLYIWSPPITELMLSQMLLWQGGQREANVEHFIGATIGQNSPKSPNSPFYEWKYCITKFTHNVLLLSKNIETYHTGQEKVLISVQFLKVAYWSCETWKGRFYIECFSKLFRIAEKVNYEGQVRHERREETNERQGPRIKQK